jgi:hypothetical protein
MSREIKGEVTDWLVHCLSLELIAEIFSKISTPAFWGKKYTCVGLQVVACDLVYQAELRSPHHLENMVPVIFWLYKFLHHAIERFFTFEE